MNFRKLRLVALATALGGAMGLAPAQQAGAGSVGMTPAAGKAAAGVSGNAALTAETSVSGNPRQGSPGTQSGVAVSGPSMGTSMGASGAWTSSQTFAGLSSTQMRLLQRHNALR